MSYSSFSTSYVFGETMDCISEQKTNIVNCCYKEYDTDTDDITAIYFTICYDDGTGNLACGEYEKVESIKPQDDSGVPPKGKGGILGLLDNPTIQQPLPGTTTPQKDIPTNTDLDSNLDDNLITKDDKTSVPKEDSEPLNLLEEEEQK